MTNGRYELRQPDAKTLFNTSMGLFGVLYEGRNNKSLVAAGGMSLESCLPLGSRASGTEPT